MDEEGRKDLYRRIGISASSVKAINMDDPAFRAACETSFDGFSGMLEDLVNERKFDRLAVGMAILFCAEVVIASAFRAKQLTPAEVRYLFERTTETTLDRAAR